VTKVTKLKLLSQIVKITGEAKITESELSFLPEEYKLMHIANNTECGAYKHHSIAIYNSQDKEIIISNYGTHISFTQLETTVQDIRADIQIALKQIPVKFSSTASFVEQIKSLLGEEYVDHKITCTGHSLGGFLAQLAGTQCKALGFEDVKVIAFDAPGAKEVAIKLANQLEFTGDLDNGVENYCIRPNPVNNNNEHLGKIFYVPRLFQQTADQNDHGFLSYLAKVTGIKDLCSNIEDHMIWNFTNFFELCEARNPEMELLETQDWNNSLISLDNSEGLDGVKVLNPDFIQFNRGNNGTNPEYLSYDESTEEGWIKVNLYDHDDIINFYAGNYDVMS